MLYKSYFEKKEDRFETGITFCKLKFHAYKYIADKNRIKTDRNFLVVKNFSDLVFKLINNYSKIVNMKNQKYLNFNVVITQDEDGIYVADCPAVPGCHSQGSTYEDAEKNIKEAIKLCLKVAEEDKDYKDSIDFDSANFPLS